MPRSEAEKQSGTEERFSKVYRRLLASVDSLQALGTQHEVIERNDPDAVGSVFMTDIDTPGIFDRRFATIATLGPMTGSHLTNKFADKLHLSVDEVTVLSPCHRKEFTSGDYTVDRVICAYAGTRMTAYVLASNDKRDVREFFKIPSPTSAQFDPESYNLDRLISSQMTVLVQQYETVRELGQSKGLSMGQEAIVATFLAIARQNSNN